MAVDFRELTISFDPTTNQEQRQSATAVFGSSVNRADAALKSFDVTFNNGDHHLLREQVDIDVTAIQNNTVEVAVNYVLRDNSGNFDDPYSGTVGVLVIADVA